MTEYDVSLDDFYEEFFNALEDVMLLGAKKYGDMDFYDNPLTWSKHMVSLHRHLLTWQYQEETDKESNQSHLMHAVARLFMLWIYERDQIGKDDVTKRNV